MDPYFYVGALALGSTWVRQRLWLAAVGAPGVAGVVLLGAPRPAAPRGLFGPAALGEVRRVVTLVYG